MRQIWTSLFSCLTFFFKDNIANRMKSVRSVKGIRRCENEEKKSEECYNTPSPASRERTNRKKYQRDTGNAMSKETESEWYSTRAAVFLPTHAVSRVSVCLCVCAHDCLSSPRTGEFPVRNFLTTRAHGQSRRQRTPSRLSSPPLPRESSSDGASER